MKCSTHFSYGILTGTICAALMTNDANTAIATIGLASVGALLPDIDSKTSSISNLLIFPKWLPLKHRGFMHSFFFAFICFIINIPLGFGVLSHILLDLLNYRKVELLKPFSRKKYALKICKSGGKMDECLKVLAIGMTALIFIT